MSGSSVCVMVNKLGRCLLAEFDNQMESFKQLGPEPKVIDAQLTKDGHLRIYAVGEIYIYEDLSQFEGVALTLPIQLSREQKSNAAHEAPIFKSIEDVGDRFFKLLSTYVDLHSEQDGNKH
jgi:hypothetical protein